jgi:hypothetical protein
MKQEHTTDLITDIQSVTINFDEKFRCCKLYKNEHSVSERQFYHVNGD